MRKEILSESPKIEIYNCDNMELMKNTPDKYYDIAIVDPPYGIGESWGSGGSMNTISKEMEEDLKKWDSSPPSKEYFSELKRISKNQIIWGGNYYFEHLGNCHHVIIWDKKNREVQLADGELAWTSFRGTALRIFDKQPKLEQREKDDNKKYHPTQKPIRLYKWLIQNYCKNGFKIVDTNLGSGGICLAVKEICDEHNIKLELDGCEISEKYFKKIINRFRRYSSNQKSLF